MQTALIKLSWSVPVKTRTPWISSMCRGIRSENRTAYTYMQDVFSCLKLCVVFLAAAQWGEPGHYEEKQGGEQDDVLQAGSKGQIWRELQSVTPLSDTR